MRMRSDWISRSCARSVADILPFSACKAAIMAFKATGSSGKSAGACDMPMATISLGAAP